MIRGIGILLWAFCTMSLANEQSLTFLLGQKQMLDLRYYCNEDIESNQCKQPVTELHPELRALIIEHQIGGIILFAENVETVPQTQAFIQQLQEAVHSAGLPPLLIAIDQEGGRVSRLPANVSNAFAGNMAIGATYAKHGTQFAGKINGAIAEQLQVLGVNVNFAPTVDVNVNPLNPVINVRSYGESALRVSELGQVAVAAFQQQGVIAAMKHFPGHGDTHVDSHTGLPVVEHTREQIEQVDLLPFAEAIKAGDHRTPAMIMTAHIQYPALDNTVFTTSSGEQTVLPATMSKKILTDLLRTDMGYTGVVVTDALDMAGIAHYMNESQALLTTFAAGADIALMPHTLRTPADIGAYNRMMVEVKQRIQAGAKGFSNAQNIPTLESLAISAQRIAALKQRFLTTDQQKPSEMPRFDELDESLADAAMTVLPSKAHFTLPTNQRVAIFMPDEARCQAMEGALAQYQYQVQGCMSLANEIDMSAAQQLIDDADAVLIGDISPQHSMAEMGGMDDLVEWQNRMDKDQQYSGIRQLLSFATERNKKRLFVALRAPYIIDQFASHIDVALVTYDYRVYQDANGDAAGLMFERIAAVMSGKVSPNGQLPVSIESNAKH